MVKTADIFFRVAHRLVFGIDMKKICFFKLNCWNIVSCIKDSFRDLIDFSSNTSFPMYDNHTAEIMR